jgi:hypothetical protein
MPYKTQGFLYIKTSFCAMYSCIYALFTFSYLCNFVNINQSVTIKPCLFEGVMCGGRACNCGQNCFRIIDKADFSACEKDWQTIETTHEHSTQNKEGEVKE